MKLLQFVPLRSETVDFVFLNKFNFHDIYCYFICILLSFTFFCAFYTCFSSLVWRSEISALWSMPVNVYIPQDTLFTPDNYSSLNVWCRHYGHIRYHNLFFQTVLSSFKLNKTIARYRFYDNLTAEYTIVELFLYILKKSEKTRNI